MANQPPSFSYERMPPYLTPTYIVVAPLPPYTPNAPPMQIVASVRDAHEFPMDMSDELREELRTGKRYLVIYGRIQYEDFLGKCWFQFCTWKPFAEQTGTYEFPIHGCIDYNVEGGTPKTLN